METKENVDLGPHQGEGDAGEGPSQPQETTTEESKELAIAERVLSIGLIAERVASYLSFYDMKSASMVSKAFEKSFRGTSVFGENAVLLVCNKTIQLPNFFVDTAYPWKAIQVDLSMPKEVMELLLDILQTVHTMRLVLSSRNNSKTDIVDFLISLFISAPNLTSLTLVRKHLSHCGVYTNWRKASLKMILPHYDMQMESTFFEEVLHDVFADTGVQAQLVKLHTLEITTGDSKPDSTCYINGEEGEDAPFPRNFLQLSLIPMQLTCFKLAKIGTVIGSETDHVKFIPNIVAANMDTLEELSLHLGVWRLKDMKSIRCPKLKRLSVSAYPEDAGNVVAFLQNHPPLEQLVIHMRDYFPLAVINTIQGKSSKLRKLHLKGKMFSDNAEGTGPQMDWSFLSQLAELKDFSISRPYSNSGYSEDYGSGVSFLRFLPPTLRRLHIRGLDNFWTDIEQENEDLPADEKAALLSKFKNLRSLRLVRCEESLDDELLEMIFKEFVGLRELEFTHCDSVTDNAFAIQIEGDEGAETDPEKCIANLKALRSLSIQFCPNVTAEGLQQAVSSSTLRFFDFLSVFAASEEFLVQFVKQNPSLEGVSVFLSNMDVNTEVAVKLRQENPRIWKFVNYNTRKQLGNDSDDEGDELDEDLDVDDDSDADLVDDGSVSGGFGFDMDALDELGFEDVDDDDYDDFGDVDDDDELYVP